LIRRLEGVETHVWSAPLVVNTTTGVKFGKSEAGAIWLDEDETSVYQFYQFWLNVEDDSVENLLKIYTLLDKESIVRTMAEFNRNRGVRVAQKTLAYEVTKLVHGEKKAKAVRQTTDVLFGSGNFRELSNLDVKILEKELPVVRTTEGESFLALLVRANLAESNTEANRLLAQGAITINGQKVTTEGQPELRKGPNLLKRGKNNFAIIEH
jgi:tyrosyl-tRNA synthetase